MNDWISLILSFLFCEPSTNKHTHTHAANVNANEERDKACVQTQEVALRDVGEMTSQNKKRHFYFLERGVKSVRVSFNYNTLWAIFCFQTEVSNCADPGASCTCARNIDLGFISFDVTSQVQRRREGEKKKKSVSC